MNRSSVLGLLLLAGCHDSTAPLVDPADIQGDALPVPLTQSPGDALRGQSVFSNRETGHCVLCHIVDGLDVPFQGNVGPDLTYVANRLTPAQLRLRIVDYQLVRPGTLMPSYYRNHDLYQVGEAYENATILSAQHVEDLVAYLSELYTNDDG
ncbi:MAG: sulfur oxidation c-type cytochrome SoxX [Pseudomonadota bacterium]